MGELGAGQATVAASRGAVTTFAGGGKVFFIYRFNLWKTCAMIRGINNKRNRKGTDMLDLPTNTIAADMAVRHGDDIYAIHNNPADVGLFSRYAKVERVPIEAHTPSRAYDERDGIDYDVMSARPVEGYSALYNRATDSLLNVRPVSRHYALIPHEELFMRQAALLHESELPTDNVTVTDRIYGFGKRVHRTVVFHDLATVDRTRSGEADRVECRMDIFNSVDLSWAFQVFSGAYRDLCRNSLVFGGQKSYHQRKIHKGHISIDAMISKAGYGLDMWVNNKEQMDVWKASHCSSFDFQRMLKQTICRKKTKAAQHDEKLAINESKLNWLLERFEEETPELGNTLWAAYNALTHYATHLPGITARNNNRELEATRRNDEVRDVIGSSFWQGLERNCA